MDCNLTEFYVKSITRVHFLDEKIYPNNYVEYSPYLHWDELIFYKDTVATVYFDDFVFHVQPNDILYLPGGAHKKYIVKFQDSGTFTDVFFIPNIPLNSTPILYKSSPQINTYINFQQLLAKWQQDKEGNHAKCMSLFWDLIYKIQLITHHPLNQHNTLLPAIEYIKSNYLDPHLSVNDMAMRCGISYSQFIKVFKEVFSTTPKAYIIRLKINQACELLRTDKSITEISDALGFSDVYFFSKQFKNYMNISPKEYRKKFLQNNMFFNKVQPLEKV
ncbi:MAG: helix-turn-helix transcriptional regulator [Clostridia bacterium]|nr:helix-turn-helix transcriptional regulator [Clostridia bacterium]